MSTQITIPCAVYECDGEATRGGIFRMGSNHPDKPIYPTYYYCDEHEDRLEGPGLLDRWEVRNDRRA